MTLLIKRFLQIVTFAVASDGLAQRVGQQPGAPTTDNAFAARVEVLAFDSEGRFLGSPVIRIFESEDRKDIASTFQKGVADKVPFGVYRIEAYVSGFYSEVRYVAVYRSEVTVIVGLPLGRESLTLPSPAIVRGRVLGTLPANRRVFVKLTGIYSNRDLEARIGPNGEFSFGVPWEGRYLLLVIDEAGVLASRTIDVPLSNSVVEIKIGAP